MAKKIYDIKPPGLVSKVSQDTKRSSGKLKKKKSEPVVKSPKLPKDEERTFPGKEVFIGGAVIVLLLGIFFYNKLPKAEILISPQIDSISLQEKITTDKNIGSIDVNKKIIPAEYVEQIEEDSQEFPATGSASNEGKATGTIKVYNKLSPSTPLTLKIGTHFLSNSGKYFVTLSRIIIPAAQGKTPGSIEVKVEAQESGQAYNIGSSKFSVPKLSGTEYYYGIWAESSKDMTGGYTGKLKKVTKDDIGEAKSVLTKKLLSEAEDSLKSKITPDFILLDDAISREVLSVNSDIEANVAADKFNESAKVKVSALVFKRQDLEGFAKGYILSKLRESENTSEGMTRNYIDKSLEIKYNPELIDMSKGTETLNLELSAKTYYEVDKVYIIDLSAKKSSQEIEEIVNQKYGDKVNNVKIDFWPFWVKSAPTNKNRINIDLNLEY